MFSTLNSQRILISYLSTIQQMQMIHAQKYPDMLG